jgi:chemosensory pili system protein ChpA (sensor histidine kinase/response regulator)
MSIPFQDMPELRATFEADANGLITLATEQLAGLNQSAPNFSLAASLRNTIHSLRGASAMIGAQVLTALVDDYERLIEIADSFRLSAPERAQKAYFFLQNQLPHLRQAVRAILDDQAEDCKRCYDLVHSGILASWGGYFYASEPEDSGTAPHETGSKPAPKAPRPGAKGTGGRRGDDDQIAREFLSSLGVETTVPPAPPASPAPEPPAAAEQIDPEMLTYFVLETNESLAQIEGLVLAWEKDPGDFKVAHSVFRLVHTVKGAANSLGLVRIGRLLHGLEDLLESHVVDRVFPRLAELIEVILGVADVIKALVREAETGVIDPANTPKLTTLGRRIQTLANTSLTPLRVAAAEEAPAPPVSVSVAPAPAAALPLNPEPSQAASSESPKPEPAVAQTPKATPEPAVAKPEVPERAEPLEHQTIRVDSDRLNLLMNLIGELVISRSRLEKKLTDISRLKEEMFFGKTRLLQAITEFQDRYEYSRPVLERNRLAKSENELSSPPTEVNRLAGSEAKAENLSGFSELEFDQYDEFNILARTLMEIGTDTGEIIAQLNRFFDAFGEETDQFSKITARLQDEITHVRMMPLTMLFQRLKRAARDASRKEHKDINFGTTENDARLDKLILDQLYTPLLHIVRNAVSHGIEAEEDRLAAGKPAGGQIRIRAACEANQVVLEVSDDGRGLDLKAIRAAAISRGLLHEGAEADDEALTQFIFQPGFTTAVNVTEVSGRGVGLDVVRQEIARLSGTVHVRSVLGQGCTFVIHLPLTLAINQAMFITAGDQTCALPLNFVERVQDGQTKDLVLSGQQELVRTPEGMVPLLSLRRLLNLPGAAEGEAIVLARVADRRVAIGVDQILRKQDIVVKPLGPLLQEHALFSGATLGGDGQVVMILDLPRVLENERSEGLPGDSAGIQTTLLNEPGDPSRPLILVVDDSLSVRKVIEKHLHSLQFRVELAVDGLDALEKLRIRPASLVLTDLEMPRMHGFELIAEMRRQEAFRAIPVIVVTSRDADKHRRRATALGANDYIIKPFSREQLAEYINRHLAKATH